MVLDNSEDYLTQELDKHKRKLKEITTQLDGQHQLLRLIVQVNSKKNYLIVFTKALFLENGDKNRG